METWEISATELARLVRARQVSARDAAKAALDRIDAVNGPLNAIVEHRPEEVLAAAEQIDQRIAGGEDPGVLAGVPVTVKVIIDQAGYATTNGAVARRDCVATVNNPVVDNLLSEGAVLLGRTNTPAYSYRWFTSNQVHGATHNPHDARLTPGGSSGGAGSAVASGMGNIALGTDIAGSIRYPAYACGVHGLRPSVGRVPAYNTTMAERSISGQLMAVTGPLARSVADLRLALTVLSKPSARDPFYVPAPLVGPDCARRAALCLQPDGMRVDPAVIEHLRAAAERLTEAGWDVHELDRLPPLREAVRPHVMLWMGDHYEQQLAQAEADGDRGAVTALRGQAEIARSMTMGSLSDALTQRATLMRQWQQFLADYAVVLMPVSGELPFDDDLDLQGDDAYRRVWEAQIPQIALPLIGLPAVSLCTGAVGTRPVGVQIAAARFREDLCLRAAEDIERLGYKPGVVG